MDQYHTDSFHHILGDPDRRPPLPATQPCILQRVFRLTWRIIWPYGLVLWLLLELGAHTIHSLRNQRRRRSWGARGSALEKEEEEEEEEPRLAEEKTVAGVARRVARRTAERVARRVAAEVARRVVVLGVLACDTTPRVEGRGRGRGRRRRNNDDDDDYNDDDYNDEDDEDEDDEDGAASVGYNLLLDDGFQPPRESSDADMPENDRDEASVAATAAMPSSDKREKKKQKKKKRAKTKGG